MAMHSYGNPGKAKGMSYPNTATGRLQQLPRGKLYGKKAGGGYSKKRKPMSSGHSY